MELMGHLTEATVSTWTNFFGVWSVSRPACGPLRRRGRPWEVTRGSRRRLLNRRRLRCRPRRRRVHRQQTVVSAYLETVASRIGPTTEPAAGPQLEAAEPETAEPATAAEELDFPEATQEAAAVEPDSLGEAQEDQAEVAAALAGPAGP